MIKRIIEKGRIAYIHKTDDASDSKLRAYYKKFYGVTIGRYTYGYDIKEIGYGTEIGSFCSFASGVKIGQMNHPIVLYRSYLVKIELAIYAVS